MSLALPPVTIVMPIRNEAQFIARSLGAVLAQDYPADRMQILIADGQSDDDTRAIIRALPGAERVQIVDNPGRKQAEGLNLLIPLATGEYVIRVDGHTIIAPDYVRECVRALAETGAGNVGGAMDPVGLTPMGRAIAAAGKSSFAVPTAFHVSERAQFTDTVYMGAWPRAVFDRVGLFNTAATPNEDYEFNYRLRAAGYRIYLTPRIRSQYFGRQTLRALWRQYFRYGIGKVQTLRLHPGSLRPRHLIAPLFTAGLIGGIPLALIVPLLWLPWLIGVGLYAALNLFFSFRAARRADVPVWRLPPVFLTIHLAWGLGFWSALLSPARRPT
jgi:cellulose synthase/poly-beta-1,6-N-acetylglucosamine synthase-like glycosyltransferase